MTDPIIDLFGWDTSYATSYTLANEAIKAAKSTPPDFLYDDGHGNVIKGTWSDWQFTTRGDGQNVTMQCPIPSGTFTTVMEPGVNFDLANTWVEVEVKLSYLEQKSVTMQDPTAKPGTGTQHNLMVRTASNDPLDPPVSIEASSFDFTQSYNPDMAKSICESLFKTWFTQNLNDFNHVFSIMVINETADVDDFQWLKPTDLGYAVSSTNSLDTSVFGVLAMTEGRINPLATHAIDPRLLTVAQGHSAFAVTPTLFVQKWLLPGVLAMQLGSTADDYVLTSDGLFFENVDDIMWGTFTDEENDPVPAYVDAGKFRLGLVGNLIKLEFTDLYWAIKKGITAHVNYTCYYSLSLKSGTDDQGQPYVNVLTATEAGTPSLSVTTTVADWRRYTELGFEIGMAILGAVVGGLVGGAFDAAAKGVTEAAEVAEETALKTGSETVTMVLDETLADVTEESAESIAKATTQGLEDASEDIGEATELLKKGESSETIANKLKNKARTFGQNLYATKGKMIGGIIGGAIGAAFGEIPDICDAVAQQSFSDVPSLDNFAATCVGAVQWPNSSGFTLTSANLSGALVLGGDLTVE